MRWDDEKIAIIKYIREIKRATLEGERTVKSGSSKKKEEKVGNAARSKRENCRPPSLCASLWRLSPLQDVDCFAGNGDWRLRSV